MALTRTPPVKHQADPDIRAAVPSVEGLPTVDDMLELITRKGIDGNLEITRQLLPKLPTLSPEESAQSPALVAAFNVQYKKFEDDLIDESGRVSADNRSSAENLRVHAAADIELLRRLKRTAALMGDITKISPELVANADFKQGFDARIKGMNDVLADKLAAGAKGPLTLEQVKDIESYADTYAVHMIGLRKTGEAALYQIAYNHFHHPEDWREDKKTMNDAMLQYSADAYVRFPTPTSKQAMDDLRGETVPSFLTSWLHQGFNSKAPDAILGGIRPVGVLGFLAGAVGFWTMAPIPGDDGGIISMAMRAGGALLTGVGVAWGANALKDYLMPPAQPAAPAYAMVTPPARSPDQHAQGEQKTNPLTAPVIEAAANALKDKSPLEANATHTNAPITPYNKPLTGPAAAPAG